MAPSVEADPRPSASGDIGLVVVSAPRSAPDPLRSFTLRMALVRSSSGFKHQRSRELCARLDADDGLPERELTIGRSREGTCLTRIGHAAWTCLDDVQTELACDVAGRNHDTVQVNHTVCVLLHQIALHRWG